MEHDAQHSAEDEHEVGGGRNNEGGEEGSGKEDGDDQESVGDEDGANDEDGADGIVNEVDRDGAGNGGDSDWDADLDYLPPGSPQAYVGAVHDDVVSFILCAIVFVPLLTILF